MKNVYAVIRKNPDLKDYMVEILGIFASKEAAQIHRQQFFDRIQIHTEIVSYVLIDTIES